MVLLSRISGTSAALCLAFSESKFCCDCIFAALSFIPMLLLLSSIFRAVVFGDSHFDSLLAKEKRR